MLFYGGSERREVLAALPGVTVLDDRVTNRGTTVTITPAELTAYEEEIEHFSR